jgi:hypothetical protein
MKSVTVKKVIWRRAALGALGAAALVAGLGTQGLRAPAQAADSLPGHVHTPFAQTAMAPGTMVATSATKAADLRVALNNLLSEHVVLAAHATGAALVGRTAEYKAAVAALDANSNDITRAIAGIYGEDAGKAFGPLWKRHIGFVVDYTTGLAMKDKAKQDKAVADLLGYTQDFGAFLSSATKSLPAPAVADLVKAHILTLKDVIDAQAVGDQEKGYSSLRKAYGHMSMIADPLAEAIVKQFAERFSY